MSKAVLITGAAGNLGSAVTEKFLHEGYHVIAVVEPRTRHHFPENPNLEVKEANLFDEDAARVVVQQAFDQFPTLNAGVLLVGGFAMGNLIRTSYREMEQMFELNFKSTYNVARPLFLRMQAQGNGGRLVMIGSRPALEPTAGGADMMGYALSKSLVFKLSELLNVAGVEKNIRSTVVVPSVIDTPTNRAAMPTADFSTWVKPEELAAIIETACRMNGVPTEAIIKAYGKT
ncbi:MAG: SDR family NAD(P)-dependent oxidoreductase [Cytophagales bacterium]|nr:SDR family NAD(P)-dependent oxidoreductase [Cytophagales bacterium]